MNDTISAEEFFSQEENKDANRIADKNPEDKIYIILSIIDDDDTSGVFNICNGRTDCYKTIAKLLDMYDDYDVDKSIVLVESKQINIKTKKEEYFMTNYLKSASVYAFCKQVEWYFEDRDDVEFIEIDNYKRESTEEDSNDDNSKKYNTILEGSSVVVNTNMRGINKESYDIWLEATKGL